MWKQQSGRDRVSIRKIGRDWHAHIGILLLVAGVLPTSARGAAFTLLIDPQFGSTEATGSTATVEFEFGSNGDDRWLLLILTNTTPTAIGSRLTAVGLEWPTSLIDTPTRIEMPTKTYFDRLGFDVNVVPPWLDAPGGYDLMLTGDDRFLGRNPQGAPLAGESSFVLLDLADTEMSPDELAMAFEQFYLQQQDRFLVGRFQSVGPGENLSDKVSGGIPEPATIVLLALGALMLQWSGPRSRRPRREIVGPLSKS